MADSANPNRIILPEATLSFPHLFQPHAMPGNQPKYSCELVFPVGTDLSKLQNRINAVAQEFFKGNVPPTAKNPLRNGAERKYPEYQGKLFVSARSTDRPGIVAGPGRDPVTDQGEIYPGCVVIVSVTVYGYDKSGNRGVGLALNNVWKIRDGERLDSRICADEEFSDLPPQDFGTSVMGMGQPQQPMNNAGFPVQGQPQQQPMGYPMGQPQQQQPGSAGVPSWMQDDIPS